MRGFAQWAAHLGATVAAAIGLVTPQSYAQDFHINDWVYISSVHPKGHTFLQGPYKEAPNSLELFYPFMASNAYPGALNGNALWCYSSRELGPDKIKELGPRNDIKKTGRYSLETSVIDDLLSNLKRDAKWMVSGGQSFGPVYTYATGPRYNFIDIPILGYSLDPAGDRVNYVGCSPGLNFMAVNAQHSTEGSNFMTIGENVGDARDKPMVLDLMPMHELIHVHQNNYAPYKLAKYDRRKTGMSWLIEGTADAVAMHRVHTLHGGHKAALRKIGSYSDKYYRRFYLLRNYNIPLNFEQPNSSLYALSDWAVVQAIDKRMWNALAYETNGFWFHIIERYLKKDAGKFTDLFGQLDTLATENVTQQVDLFLNKYDGDAQQGLEHVYPQFLAEFTNWWDVRTNKRISERKWLNAAYNGCKTFDLTTTQTHDTQPFDVSDYAGKCVDITIDSAAAQRLNDVQLIVAGADQSSDEIYIGMSRISGTKRGTTTCFDIVEARGTSTAPCLIDPYQGFANWKGGTATAKQTLLRSFNVTDIQGVAGQDIKIRMVVVRVPAKHYDVVGKLKRKTLDLSVSLDLAALTPKAGLKPKKRAVMTYGARQDEGAVSPDGDVDVMDATLEDALRGRVGTTGVPGGQSSVLNQLISVELIDENETNFSVGFILQEALTEGMTGPVKVIGVMGERKINGAQVVSFQDPDYESRLEILDYNEATLRIEGQVNVCAGPQSLLFKEGADLCRDGERLSFGVDGAVAFPTLVNGQSQFSIYSTLSYEAYKDLRMARLQMDPRAAAIGVGPVTGVAPNQSGEAGGTPSAVCRILAPTGSCDCSCDAKTCFASKTADQSLSGQEKSCRLTCGKRWQSCPAAGPTP
jgi:hypothetical protein